MPAHPPVRAATGKPYIQTKTSAIANVAFNASTAYRHGGAYPGDMPWDFMQPLASRGRLSPRTERVKNLNNSMRGFLTELDFEYRQKKRSWTDAKKALELKLGELKHLCTLSRYFVRKALQKLRDRTRGELVAACYHSWARALEKKKSMQRAARGTNWLFMKTMKPLLSLCFLGLKQNWVNLRYRCRMVMVNPHPAYDEMNVYPTMRQIQQLFQLWRIGCEVSKVERHTEAVEGDDEDAVKKKTIQPPVHPGPDAEAHEIAKYEKDVDKFRYYTLQKRHVKASLSTSRGANAVFMRGAWIHGLHALAKRRKARVVFSAQRNIVNEIVNIEIIFARWHLYRYESQAQNRRILNHVMKIEKMLARKGFSGWARIVWTAKSEAYWKNELDERLAVFEKQRQKYEEQVNILEEQLPRFIPDFGKNVLPRDKKKTKKSMGFSVMSPPRSAPRG
jgi:hypothetical protein